MSIERWLVLIFLVQVIHVIVTSIILIVMGYEHDW